MERIPISPMSTVEWAVFVALAEVNDEVKRKVKEMKVGDCLDVELKVNGQEVPFTKIIARMKENAEQWSFDKARILLEDRASELSEKLYQLTQIGNDVEAEIKRRIHKILPEALTNEDFR